MIRAILSHGDHTGVARESRLEHTLFACDELSGFIVAAALVRPSKSVLDLEVGSVRKRMKDKAFARAVSREDLQRGADELGLPLDEHIGHVIAALREAAEPLGLKGACDRRRHRCELESGAPRLLPAIARRSTSRPRRCPETNHRL